jgi:Divergent InlB B-repeat domain
MVVPALVLAAIVAVLAASSAAALVSADLVVTVVVDGVGKVLVQPSNITCQATCETTVSAGVEVTLRATPASGFVLATWHDACAGTDGDVCVIHPDADTTVTAVFVAASPPLTTTTTTATTTPPPPPPPPPPPTTPPPIPPPVDPAGEVAEAVKNLPVATVAFNTPTRLHRTETATIKLLLSPATISIGELEKRVNEAGQKSGAHVKYSRVMEAKLASEDFEVTPLSPEQQFVAAGQDTEWLWQIKPKRTGELHLYLTLNAIIDVRDQTGAYKVKTFSRTLTINVSLATHVGDFVKGNWQWLWTAVLVPVGLWWYRRRTKPTPPAEGT